MSSSPREPIARQRGTERRSRARICTEVTIAFHNAGALVTSSTRDISAGGAFISAIPPLPLGTALDVTLSHGTSSPLTIPAKVVRVVWGGRQGGEPAPTGMAVAFSSSPALQEALLAFLRAAQWPS